ncbi:MAG: asparagine synthase (glutamine-hydrolyzing) [Chitinophagales bacterium]|nr:asparagine synthase (glutamine-hydrolyzing) [Chitinophagales bacterium]MDW8417913.1 asparagine synthase (glutamine-hydrolyzing) [Chitinophagales bacterium]
MCGIAGYISFKGETDYGEALQRAIARLRQRGPDNQASVRLSAKTGFAHARLSIIDTSSAANQPMHDSSGRYTIIFNGEIFNYRELRQKFLPDVVLQTTSDTEVLLQLFMRMGKGCLQYLNGFFAFAIYDAHTGQTFLARDRYGIKPLHLYRDAEKMFFASELKALLEFPVQREIEWNVLPVFLQLNYVPPTLSMLKGIRKLPPGSYALCDETGQYTTGKYYEIPYTPGSKPDAGGMSFEEAKQKLHDLLDEAVKRRLVSDVPLGAFLSGGFDSSIVSACAARHTPHLHTFSIGFRDEPYFDETYYANLVAKKIGSEHTVFSIANEEIFACIDDILNYIDEPFADPSSIAVYVLSRQTRRRVTVALSGDGGDELFAGYNKHRAELQARENSALNFLIRAGYPVLRLLPGSRHSALGNRLRQLLRYSEGLRLSAKDRYWRWCSFQSQEQVLRLLSDKVKYDEAAIDAARDELTRYISPNGTLNDVLYSDMHLVLPGDMLTKVDLMSMANSLEVRVPMLDYTVVNFAFSLPVHYKRDGSDGKRILKEAFRDELPPELFTRRKMGFEVPILKWFRKELLPWLEREVFDEQWIEEQGIFSVIAMRDLREQLFSTQPGDVQWILLSLLSFQRWYRNYYLSGV